MVSRRQFTFSAAALAFSGLTVNMMGCRSKEGNNAALADMPLSSGYGDLVSDKNSILDLPPGFSYQVISQLGDKMDDGMPVPDNADGMGCIKLDEDRVALIRNHELAQKHMKKSAAPWQSFQSNKSYDNLKSGTALPGGTSTLVYNLKTQEIEKQYMSLIGTIRNCAGGTTPWGTWLTCEESVDRPDGNISKDHGYIFEVPAEANGLVEPKPLVAMGRFNHEAAAVDPRTGITYLTEDRGDSLIYRFIPKVKGQLSEGGILQALVVKQKPKFDTRNWAENNMALGDWLEVEWITLSNPESPNDDLRAQGYEAGAALFARGEGIHFGTNELYFCCTNGGQKQFGQVMRYQPSAFEGTAQESQHPGLLQLFVESTDGSQYNFGDNLTVTPQGHLLVCEDQYTDVTRNFLRGVTPKGAVYPFAKLHIQTEPAGACFSHDGKTLFVNLYSPTKTLAITGPWEQFSAQKA